MIIAIGGIFDDIVPRDCIGHAFGNARSIRVSDECMAPAMVGTEFLIQCGSSSNPRADLAAALLLPGGGAIDFLCVESDR